jgi:hypothetical protein
MKHNQQANSSQSFISIEHQPRFSSSLASGLVETRIVKGQSLQVYLGKHLAAIASVQNREENQSALILEFESMNGNLKRCFISRGDLVGRGGKKIFASLLARGYYYERKHQDVILDYLSGLGRELPEIIAYEGDFIGVDLSKLVPEVTSTDDMNNPWGDDIGYTPF